MKRIAVVLVAFMVVACNTPPKKEVPPTPQADTKKTAPPSTTGSDQGKLENKDLVDPNQSVYFDFGKATINPGYRAVIQKHAEFIVGHDKDVVTLEGNCDERGSAEYNLGLGQRRADAVKKLLVDAGVPANRVKSTSLGKEKPKLSCHAENCWKENRRVDLVQGS